MRSTFFGVSFLLVLGIAGPSLAQPMVPGGGLQRPTVSPYINLVRGNNNGISNAALNYFGVVRPEQQFRQQATQLQQQLAMTNQNLGSLAASESESQQPTTITGKGATFVNYSHYFNNFGGAGGGGSTSRSAGSFGGGMTGSSSGRGASSGFTIGQSPGAGRGSRR